MIIKFIRKYYVVLIATLFTVFFGAYFLHTYTTNYGPFVEKFNTRFVELEERLEKALDYRCEDLKVTKIDNEWSEVKTSNEFNFHIYRNDSLKYWNTNQLPIIRFADIHFPFDGILHLQNGWYYAKVKEVNDFTVSASFLIKNDFPYENKDLTNDFHNGLELPFEARINIGEESGFQVKNNQGEYIFSIVPDDVQRISETESIILTLLLLISIIFWLVFLSNTVRGTKFGWAFPVLLVTLRLASLYFGWFGFMKGNLTFDPSIYGSNVVFPNFFEYLLNVIIISYLLFELNAWIKQRRKSFVNAISGQVLFVLSTVIWWFILWLTRGLIENSTISMEVNELFTLSAISILALASLGVLFYQYFQLVLSIIKMNLRNDIQLTRLTVIAFVFGCIYFYYEVNFGYQILFPSIFPIILYGIALYLGSKERSSKRIASGLILLFLFSSVMSASIEQLIQQKEKSERELFADQLATEKSIATEVEYGFLSKKIEKDNFLKRYISNPFDISVSDFQENLERRFFDGYWERYEVEFHLFDENNIPMVDNRLQDTKMYDHLQSILDSSGVISEVNPGIYYIRDYTDQYSYIIKQKVEGRDSSRALLMCTLKSKKIPEEIGFPRLLISSEANVFESLEAYSIARYRKGRLLNKYGDFNFPSALQILGSDNVKTSGFVDYGGYSHYVLKKSDNNVVVLSQKHETWIDEVTSFSYLFSFYGLLILPLLFRGSGNQNMRRTFSLAMKIQLVLISLVFLSLLTFGWGSGVFIRDQYNEFTNDMIREKLNSVESEVKAKLGDFEELSIDENGDYMQFILQKFSRVFFTDINLYDTDGYLLATSRPNVFNVGLISEQMNPVAYKNLKYDQRSEFVHQESIGRLNYSSAYQPFYNSKDQKLAFINLQHFGQQREFETQIEKFLVAIINVFILLLAVSIILAIFISNWLTSPLRILQENFAHIRFGQRNERISYDKEDEIGALVKEYNEKLDELEYTANQLAKSERESAWREMAKQVAHEIKNPLTPMKLSVQQLLRSFDPNDPKSKEKLERVANSIVEQIDALTSIANEFSNFAKMPNPTESRLNLVQLVTSVVELFGTTDRVKIELNTPTNEYFIKADKDQMMRVINNLIKNAIQAIPGEKDGVIKVDLKKEDDFVIVEITDNGSGIDEKEFSKIFVPYFTTKSTGTGLGLAMVKQIVENHHGTIDFESKKDVGTTFYIKLPLDK